MIKRIIDLWYWIILDGNSWARRQGVKIGNDCRIYTTKSVPSGVIIGGNPAKILGNYDTYKAKVFSGYVSESDMDFTKTYKERILEIVDQSVKPSLKK